jgi:hypothetical protein
VAALALAALVAALAAWAPARDTVAGWLGVRGVVIQRVPVEPTPPAASPGLYGMPTTLSGARSRAAFPVREPIGAAGAAVYYSDQLPGGEVAFVSSVGGRQVVVTEVGGQLQSFSLQKALGPDTTLTPVTVNGRNGFWLAGHPHLFFFVGSDGRVVEDSLRLAGNTLVWEQGGVIYRVEGESLTESAALEIAAGLR